LRSVGTHYLIVSFHFKRNSDFNAALESGEIGQEWPIMAADLNAELVEDPNAFIRTLDEQETEPYPDNVQLKAFMILTPEDSGEGTEEDPYTWVQPHDHTAFKEEVLFEVLVIERVEVEAESDSDDEDEEGFQFMYTVVVADDDQADYNGGVSYITQIPESAFVFVDVPGSSDQFTNMENANFTPFRHVIGIPDDVFPQGPWRNAGTIPPNKETTNANSQTNKKKRKKTLNVPANDEL